MGFVSALLVGNGVVFDHQFWEVRREWRTRGFLAAKRARLSGNSVVFEGRKPIGLEKDNIISPYIPMTLLAYHLS